MAQIVDLNIDKDSDFLYDFLYEPGGVAQDLTGYAAEMQLRETYGSTSATLTLTTANGRLVISGNKVTVSLAASVTALLSNKYFYDLILVFGATRRRIAEGTVYINPSITPNA